MAETFRALVVRESEEGKFTRAIEERRIDELPEGDVLIRVKYSSLNYKDGLSAAGNKGVTRQYPHQPGIDAAGTVAACSGGAFSEGDEVLVTGYDLGMNTAGGFGEYVRVPADWVVPLPAGLSLKESMVLGTAGFTAGLCLERLERNGHSPADGPTLVTGATGGVGSLAVAILARAGYSPVAMTGKKSEQEAFLKGLGAQSVIGRDEIDVENKKPMLKALWGTAIDTVGGDILSALLKHINLHGGVSCCGLVAGPSFSTTVFPFIIRGVCLYGIGSAETPMPLRRQIWEKLAAEWKPQNLSAIAQEINLGELSAFIDKILAGQMVGRAVVAI